MLIFCTFNFFKSFSQSDSILHPMGLGETNIGTDVRIANFETRNNPTVLIGFYGKVQASIFYIITKHKYKRLQFGDILSGEFTLSNRFDNGFELKADIWAAYRFCVGVGAYLQSTKITTLD